MWSVLPGLLAVAQEVLEVLDGGHGG
jgi:hypothetical protein